MQFIPKSPLFSRRSVTYGITYPRLLLHSVEFAEMRIWECFRRIVCRRERWSQLSRYLYKVGHIDPESHVQTVLAVACSESITSWADPSTTALTQTKRGAWVTHHNFCRSPAWVTAIKELWLTIFTETGKKRLAVRTCFFVFSRLCDVGIAVGADDRIHSHGLGWNRVKETFDFFNKHDPVPIPKKGVPASRI